MDKGLKEELTSKIKAAAELENNEEKTIDAFMSFFSDNPDPELQTIIIWLNDNQTNEKLLDIFCTKLRANTLTNFPCETSKKFEQYTEDLKRFLQEDQEEAIEEFEEIQKKQNGAIGMNNINPNLMINNNMMNNNPMMNNIINNIPNQFNQNGAMNMMNNNNMNNNNNNNPMINNNMINNNNQIQQIQQPPKEEEINTNTNNNINLHNRNALIQPNNNNNNNNNNVLDENKYNNFIQELLFYSGDIELQREYGGKMINNPKTFQKKTNVCWLCRLFNCCTPTQEIALDDIVRKKIDNNPTSLSCDELIRDFNRQMLGED